MELYQLYLLAFFTEYFSLPKSQNCTVFPLTAFYFFQHHLVLTLLLLLLPVFSVLVFCSVNQSRHFLLSQLRWKIVYHVQFSPDFVVDSGSWLLVGFSFQSIATLMVVVHLSLHFAQLDIAYTSQPDKKAQNRGKILLKFNFKFFILLGWHES